jgi:hypothetical protein
MQSMQSAHTLSRRGFVAAAGAAWAAAYLAPGGALAAETDGGPVQTMRRAAAAAKVEVQALRGGVSVLSGSGGIIAVLDGPEGKLLVDAGISNDNVRAALDGLGKGPVRYLVNTHWHFDHTDGNAWLGAAGATIVAHENTRKHLATATRVEGWRFTFPPSPPEALPAVGLRGPGDAAPGRRGRRGRALRPRPHRRRRARHVRRRRRRPRRGHLVERPLPVHRLLHRREHRRGGPRGRGERRGRRRQDAGRPRPRPGRRPRRS